MRNKFNSASELFRILCDPLAIELIYLSEGQKIEKWKMVAHFGISEASLREIIEKLMRKSLMEEENDEFQFKDRRLFEIVKLSMQIVDEMEEKQ